MSQVRTESSNKTVLEEIDGNRGGKTAHPSQDFQMAKPIAKHTSEGPKKKTE